VALVSKLSRTKGRTFEQKVARIIRERWPSAVVHRSSQADRAYDSDVVIEPGDGIPACLPRLWLELTDGRTPNPVAKLEQAERDIARLERADRIPVVVWHRLREREVWASVRLRDLDRLIHGPRVPTPTIVRMTLGDFLDEVTR
jgi:hypothetical protein